MHTLLYHFSPLILFISLYLGSGLYFAFHNVDMAFYQLSPVVAILPALILAWFLQTGTTAQIMQRFLDGARHQKRVHAFRGLHELAELLGRLPRMSRKSSTGSVGLVR